MKNVCFMRMTIKRLFFSLPLLLVLMLGNTGCSNDDEDALIDFKFQLCTIDGNNTNVFTYGDNVVFDLLITNNSDCDITYGPQDADIIFGEDLFYVYSKDSGGIGLPWTGMYCEYSLQRSFIIPANSAKHVYCTWNLSKEINTSHPLCKAEDNANLPIGNYYTKFSVKYNNKIGSSQKRMITKEFQTEFKVK